MKKFFTSESVTEGHPDKLCDYISDSLLDAYLEKDSKSRVAMESVASKGKIFVTGEVTSNADYTKDDLEKIIRETVKEIGYFGEQDIDYKTCEIEINISKQSQDIALGVDNSLETKSGEAAQEGAGDQGMMFGYACDDTEEYMPFTISYAHKLAKALTEARRSGEIKDIGPDGKTQVTVEYENDEIRRVDTVVVSTEHRDTKDIEELRKEIKEKVIKKVIPAEYLDENTKYYINPTGRFVTGGPLGDSGLTGRKIIVDTYGGVARHGGGCFSGKDPTKVDRSAAYMARHIAKNVVANGYAKRCEIQLSYAIGVAKPTSIFIDTFGTNAIPEEEIIKKIEEHFELTPRGIINYLDLQRPIYKKTTNYGHFGKADLPWEKIVKF
jgi:S-adenosylmethionine synthetase